MNTKIMKRARILLIVGVILILLAPLILTRALGIIDFSNTGQIGDTIGGITAPIASLVGSILVFFALEAQIEANQIIQEQMKVQKDEESQKKQLQNLLDQFKMLREDINDFSYITFKSDSTDEEKNSISYLTRTGRDAFRQVIVGMKQYKTNQHLDLYKLNHKLGEVKSILLAMDSLLKQTDSATIELTDKVFLRNLISYQFNSKISHAFDGMETYKASLQKPCEECGKVHIGIPDDLFDIITRIEKQLPESNE